MNKLFTIFPLSENSLLEGRKDKIKTLDLIKNTLIISQKAISSFLSKNFSFFDAQVGETSCQIRGYKIASLGNQLKDVNFYTLVRDTSFILKKKLKLVH